MSRQVKAGSTIVDSFSAISLEDGFSKISGLTNFTTYVWRDSVSVAIPVAITEIDTSGEYKIELNAGSIGFVKVQILIDYNKDIIECGFDVVDDFVALTGLMRRVLGLNQENVFIDNTVYDNENQLVSSRVRIFDSKANCDAATDGGSETTGLIASYTQETGWEGLNKFSYYRQVMEP